MTSLSNHAHRSTYSLVCEGTPLCPGLESKMIRHPLWLHFLTLTAERVHNHVHTYLYPISRQQMSLTWRAQAWIPNMAYTVDRPDQTQGLKHVPKHKNCSGAVDVSTRCCRLALLSHSYWDTPPSAIPAVAVQSQTFGRLIG